MNYDFPLIFGIDDVLWAINGRDEFVVAEKEGYTVINYNVMMADTFPAIVDGWCDSDCSCKGCADMRIAAIRRECRGIIFDSKSGAIIRRPFHKFFNVNERDETQDHVIDMSRDHGILEKLDGSMIAPFIVNGEMIWGTKMGATDVAKPVEVFVKNNPEYITFADECISNGWTPIFEWCSRKQRIVLDYFEDQLILTGMRHLNTGSYALYGNLVELGKGYSIPVAHAYNPQTDMKAFLNFVHDLEDLEGFVVRFADGHMVKLKCHWYLQIHKAKEAILQDRNIVELILEEKLDDIKAHLPVEDRDRLTQFENDFNRHIKSIVNGVWIDVQFFKSPRYTGDRKDFAINYAHNFDGYVRPIMFSMWDKEGTKEQIEAAVYNTVRNNLSRTAKYEAIRDAWFCGIVFNG